MKIKKDMDIQFKGIDSNRWLYKPRTENQQKYIDYLINPNISIVLGLGPAGTGKTLFACNTAISSLKNKLIDKIIITRPMISVDDEQMGFLPGNIAQKMDPWTRPIFDIFGESYSKTQIDNMVYNGIIEISPLAYMRGRTFKNSFIIADEMQNSSPNQMLMLLTRVGENSKLVITGDLKQSDRSDLNGLLDFTNKLKTKDENNLIKYIEMENSDIQRSDVVSQILNIYDTKKVVNKSNISNISIYKREYLSTDDNDAALIPKRLL